MALPCSAIFLSQCYTAILRLPPPHPTHTTIHTYLTLLPLPVQPQGMSTLGTWGDELTLRAAADSYGAVVRCVSSTAGSWYIRCMSGQYIYRGSTSSVGGGAVHPLAVTTFLWLSVTVTLLKPPGATLHY